MSTLETLEAQVTAIMDRVDKIEGRQDDLEKLISVIAAMQKDIEYQGKSIANIEKTVNSISEKPAKRWDAIVSAVIAGIVGLLFGLFSKG